MYMVIHHGFAFRLKMLNFWSSLAQTFIKYVLITFKITVQIWYLWESCYFYSLPRSDCKWEWKVSVTEHELHHTDVCQRRSKYNSAEFPEPIRVLRDLQEECCPAALNADKRKQSYINTWEKGFSLLQKHYPGSQGDPECNRFLKV